MMAEHLANQVYGAVTAPAGSVEFDAPKDAARAL
jgi:hypothetical protein